MCSLIFNTRFVGSIYWKWKSGFANFNREKLWTKNLLLCLQNEVYFFFKEGNLIFSIKLGQRLPKSFSQLHVKDSGFFLSYFLKKDDWPNAYAGPRLPTLLYLGVFSMTNLKFNNVHSHGGSLVDVIYKVNLHHFASSMRKLCFREKKSRLHLSNYYTYKWVEISSWHLVHP